MNYQNLKNITLFIIASVFLFSCNNDELFEGSFDTGKPTASENGKFRLTEDEAIQNLQLFLDEFDQPAEGDVATRSKPVRSIGNVQVIGKKEQEATSLRSDDPSGLRSLLLTVQEDTILYLINFEDEGGFAIVSADKRSNKIYAIIDEGTLDVNEIDQVDNPGFNMFLEEAIVSELRSVDHDDLAYGVELYSGERPGRPVEVPNKIKPLLKTKWGQDYPYNQFSPNHTTGCVPTAIAQIFSYYRPVNSVSYTDSYHKTNPSSNLTWNKILWDCESASVYGVLDSYKAYQSSLQVAHLMRYIGINVKAYYDQETGDTGANSGIAIAWLYNSMGFSKSMKMREYDSWAAYKALAGGNLIYMTASAGGNVGHAWVADGGFLHRGFVDGRGSEVYHEYYLHCNWGWNGFCDGYYLDFNLSNGADSKENIDRPGYINAKYSSPINMVIMKR